MAFITQDEKKEIRVELKKVIPVGWKWSLSIDNYSLLILKIQKAPKSHDLLTNRGGMTKSSGRQIHFMGDDTFANAETVNLFKKIDAAMNKDNYDNSDIMTDYFDVGYYTRIEIGAWDKDLIEF